MGSSDTKCRRERNWGGRTGRERRAERRRRLLDAGIELFGTEGYARTPVKAVCREAGLTERYFYEAFDDREALLAAIFDSLVENTQVRTLEAIDRAPDELFARLKVGLEAFFAALTEDPRRARIQEIETVGVSEAMEARRRDALHSYAGLIADQIRREPAWTGGDDPRLDVIALGLVGAVNEQLIEFVRGDLGLTARELLDLQSLMITAVIRPLLAGQEPA